MATRMQQRRGTAAQWISVNNGSGPILAAGEIGFESDTNKFKIGDGVNHWVDLTYFTDAASAIASLNGLVDGAPDLLNTLNEIAAAIGDDPNFFSTVSTNLSNHEADTTNVHGIEDTAQLATISYVDGAVNNVAATLPSADGVGLTWNATTEQLDVDSSIIGDGLSWSNNTISVGGDVARTTTGTQFFGDTHANNIITENLTVNDTITGNDVVLSGNLTVNGTTTTVNATNLDVTDSVIYIASGNNANSLDIGIVGAYDDGTYQHTGIVRDATDGVWKIFDGLTSEPGSTIDFTGIPMANLEVGSFIASGARIGNVTNTEIQTLGGVTSSIQTQLNDTNTRIDGVDFALNANDTRVTALEDNVATKQHSLTTGSGINIVNNEIILDYDIVQARVTNVSDAEISYLNGVTSGIQSQLDAKASSADVASTYAPIDNPTFTTAVHLPSNTSIGNITATELGYVDGVTSSIQTQLDAKASASDLTSHESATTSVHGIADTAALATKTYADNAVSTHSSDTTNVHGIADTAALATQTDVSDAQSAAEAYALSSVVYHNSTTTGVHGITDTSKLVTTDAQSQTISGALTITGDLTVQGTTTTVSATNLEITDPLIYIGTGNSANSNDLGIVGHFDNGTYQHTGLVRDASDGKWKLFSGISTEPSGTIDFTTWTKDTLVTGAIEATTVTPSSGVVFSDGTQTLAGTPSLTPINAQTASITLGASFVKDSFVQMNVASPNTITIPTDATYTYPVGASIDFQQMGAGQTSFVAASGVTFQVAKVNGSDALKFRGQFSVATALKTAANTWAIFGDLTN